MSAGVAGAIIGLPMLANASISVKDRVQWQEMALDFHGGDINADFQQSSSSFANRVAEQRLRNKQSGIQYPTLVGVEGSGISPTTLIANAKHKERELNCLAEAVYYESRSETKDGQKAVAEVVLNRVKSKNFPNTICGVVYQGAERTSGCQFSFTCDGSTSHTPSGKVWKRSKMVAQHMILEASAPMTWRSTHYHTTKVKPVWADSLRHTRQYETHVFYRPMPRKSRSRTIDPAP